MPGSKTPRVGVIFFKIWLIEMLGPALLSPTLDGWIIGGIVVDNLAIIGNNLTLFMLLVVTMISVVGGGATCSVVVDSTAGEIPVCNVISVAGRPGLDIYIYIYMDIENIFHHMEILQIIDNFLLFYKVFLHSPIPQSSL